MKQSPHPCPPSFMTALAIISWLRSTLISVLTQPPSMVYPSYKHRFYFHYLQSQLAPPPLRTCRPDQRYRRKSDPCIAIPPQDSTVVGKILKSTHMEPRNVSHRLSARRGQGPGASQLTNRKLFLISAGARAFKSACMVSTWMDIIWTPKPLTIITHQDI